jgi:hypothetical protein
VTSGLEDCTKVSLFSECDEIFEGQDQGTP